MDDMRESMEAIRDAHTPDPWRLECVYEQHRNKKASLTSDLLDLSMPSFQKEWKEDDTIPVGVVNR